jgi:hypothetical protein
MVDMKQRYLYGYSVSGMLTRSGRWWQFVGCGIGLTIVVLSFFGWGSGFLLFGIVFAAASAVSGIAMRALGQFLLAALDIAVNTSPLLSFTGKTQILEEGGALAAENESSEAPDMASSLRS